MQQAIVESNCSTLPINALDYDGIVKSCPSEFYGDNEWSNFVNIIKYRDGYNQNKWDWVSKDPMDQREQFHYLFGLINSDKFLNQNKIAAAGWYLSQILNTVPKYGNQ